ncbi:MAG: YraN family protein [Chitinophagaceae bacterium]
MAKHNLLGKEGERMAVQWLQEKGFVLLHQNWRHSYYEVDIIATMGTRLHFIEVKTRRNKNYGEPEESVDHKKIMNLMKAGGEFQHQYPQWQIVQYNVLSIIIHADNTADYFFIEDVYV